MAENRTNKIIIIIIMAILAVIIGTFAYLNAKGGIIEEGKIKLRAGNTVLGEITIADVKKLSAVNKKLVINSTSGLSKHEFTGTPLLEVLNHIDPEIVERYKKVYTKGTDNYVSGVNMEEVVEKNNVYLIYADYGKPLPNKTGTGETMRIIILNDQFGQRFTNYLGELQFE